MLSFCATLLPAPRRSDLGASGTVDMRAQVVLENIPMLWVSGVW